MSYDLPGMTAHMPASVYANTSAEIVAAKRVCALRARDADDLRHLLSMLGLLSQSEPAVTQDADDLRPVSRQRHEQLTRSVDGAAVNALGQIGVCQRDHAYTPANAYWSPRAKLECRACRRERAKHRRERAS